MSEFPSATCPPPSAVRLRSSVFGLRSAVLSNKVPFAIARRFLALSLLALPAPVFPVSAQQPTKPAAGAVAAAAPAADPCPIELMQPTGLGIANLQRPKLANVKTAVDGNAVMKDVSKLLFDDKQKVNP